MRRRVAITGLGCVTPLGSGAPAFLDGLRAGRSGVRRITLFDPAELPVRIAAEAVGFDPAAHVPAKDARHVSRVVPMAIAAAGEALASAGIDADRLSLDERRRIAVLLGSGGGPVEFFEKMYGHWYRGELKKASVYAIPTGTIGTLSSEVSMRFGLKGPSHVVSTGCTSSADALGYAARSIRYGERDLVLAGGADAVITPGIMTGFGLMQILASSRQEAPETASRPFDAGRDGFVLGEGAWFFVLEEMERARARGVPLLGEIAGYAATCDAFHRVRLDESGEEPARALDTPGEGFALREVQGRPGVALVESQALLELRLGLGEAAAREKGEPEPVADIRPVRMALRFVLEEADEIMVESRAADSLVQGAHWTFHRQPTLESRSS